MITQISPVFQFPFFLTHGAPLHALRAPLIGSMFTLYGIAFAPGEGEGGGGGLGCHLLVDLPSIAVTATDLVLHEMRAAARCKNLELSL